MEFGVRLATRADSAAAVAVVKAVFDEFGFTWEAGGYHADLYDLGAGYLAIGNAFFVSEWEGRVVGTAALKLFPPVSGPSGSLTEVGGGLRIAGADCSLDRLYVHPSARRHGIGAALSVAVIEGARDRSRRLMEIWSDKRFADAHRLYGRLGAQTVGERILDDPDQSPEWGLSLELSRRPEEP